MVAKSRVSAMGGYRSFSLPTVLVQILVLEVIVTFSLTFRHSFRQFLSFGAGVSITIVRNGPFHFSTDSLND
jgi:hypothetical protein